MTDDEFWDKLINLERRFVAQSKLGIDKRVEDLWELVKMYNKFCSDLAEPKTQEVKQQEKLKRVLTRELDYLENFKGMSLTMPQLRILLALADDNEQDEKNYDR